MMNKNTPAQPCIRYEKINHITQPWGAFKDRPEYEEVTHSGLTKREVFAMNAPDVPKWFEIEFAQKHMTNEDYYYVFEDYDPSRDLKTVDQTTLPKGEMALIKEWRYYFADTMLEK